MNSTKQLNDLGQSLWLDDMTRGLLNSGTLRRYIQDYSLTGLTSNPTIFDHAITGSRDYDDDIATLTAHGRSGEDLFFDLALVDLRRAADAFREVHERTSGVDGWASLEVSPLLANETDATIAAATRLHRMADRPNIFIKIPGTKAGLPAIEECIFRGVPINVTLLFSREHYQDAADAYMRGIERRIAAGMQPDVASVASIFVSRWDVAVRGKVPEDLRSRLGLAVARLTYHAYLEHLASERVQRAMNAGMRPQRLLWASTGSKDPQDSDTLYIEALAAPLTVNTVPEKTLKAFAEHGRVDAPMARGGNGEDHVARFAAAGVDIAALSMRLQEEGVASFAKSWGDLMARIATKSGGLRHEPGVSP